MSSPPPTRVVGCLLDVSHSMRQTLETGKGDNQAVERLQAVLSAALKLVRAEQRRETNTLVFVGVFGLNCSAGCPPVVDLCGATEALLASNNDDQHLSGHDLLIGLADENNLSHVTKYIRTKLTDQEALIVHAHLRRHPERTKDFVDAIPDEEGLQIYRTATTEGMGLVGAAALRAVLGPPGTILGGIVGRSAGAQTAEALEDHAVDNSEALRLSRQMCNEWLHDYIAFVPRPVNQVAHLLERLQNPPGETRNGDEDKDGLLHILQRYLYGRTPMKEALESSLAAFREHSLVPQGGSIQQRILLLVSDGAWTDENPFSTASELRDQGVTIATVFLTCNERLLRRTIFDKAGVNWRRGQRALFDMASRISCATHPVPVLASIGWKVPSSGECALYTTVSSISALEEFCSLLSSARFGAADMLLDIIGRIDLDAFIDDEHIKTRRTPSDQGSSETCYAHAIAAVTHMALLRVVGREGGCPSIQDIRDWILLEDNFPVKKGGWNVRPVLEGIRARYRPLRFQEVDENGARQAVLHRRPVLAGFWLSKNGWDCFSRHFTNKATCHSVLTPGIMAPHRRETPDPGGHAVVLTGCAPGSLTFLNSWGRQWGNHGSFSIQNSSVLEVDGPCKTRMSFYDVYWLESDLKDSEREAYGLKVDEKLRSNSSEYPSIFEMDIRCPCCLKLAPIREFNGSIRQAKCPGCHGHFLPEPGYLVQALYAQAGLGEGG